MAGNRSAIFDFELMFDKCVGSKMNSFPPTRSPQVNPVSLLLRLKTRISAVLTLAFFVGILHLINRAPDAIALDLRC